MSRGDYLKEETAFWNWMRNSLRRVWTIHPTKLDFIKSKRYMLPIGRRQIFHIDCNICNKPTQLREIEINHKVKCGSVKDPGYHLRLLDIQFDDIEALCKPCHGIVTYAERKGLSFEEAKFEKKVVYFSRLPAPKQKAIIGEGAKKNTPARMEQYREMLRKAAKKD